MSRRKLKDMFRVQILSVKRQRKKDVEYKTIPTFKNFDIDYDRVNDDNIEIAVRDIFDETDKGYKTVVNQVDKKGATFIISMIRCPLCGKPISLNEKWFTYLCYECEEHKKTNFEMVGVL